MVDHRNFLNYVNQSNGSQLSPQRRAKDFEAGNVSRRDCPLHSTSATYGKLRVIEKPGVTEAYTISLVSLSTPAIGGIIFTSCLLLVTTSTRSEQRVKEYPTEIAVLSGAEGESVVGTYVLVKRFILYKEETFSFAKDNYHLDYLKPYISQHITSVSVCESSISNLVMFATDNWKPCYLADENNQCVCGQTLEQIPHEKQLEKPIRPCCKRCCKPVEKHHEKPDFGETGVFHHLTSHDDHPHHNHQPLHVCAFCSHGFVGGNSLGKVCDDFFKKNDAKTELEKQEPKIEEEQKKKPYSKKKKKNVCGCLKKNEDTSDSEVKIKIGHNDRLFARMKRPSEVYIKKPVTANEQSLNVISLKALTQGDEPFISDKKHDHVSFYSPSLPQDQRRRSSLQQPAPYPQHIPAIAMYSDKVREPQILAPCGYHLVPEEYRPTCRCPSPPPPPHDHEKSCPHCGHQLSPENSSPVRQENVCHLPVSQEKTTPPCGCDPSCRENIIHSFGSSKARPVYKCRRYFRTKPTSTDTQKFKPEKLVGKKFHLLCQEIDSSDESADRTLLEEKGIHHIEKDHDTAHKIPHNSKESTESSERDRNNHGEKEKTETKVGRVEINYSKRYYPFRARLQRDSVPCNERNNPLAKYLFLKTKHSIPSSVSGSSTSGSYLSIRGKKMKRSKFPVKIKDCKSCYLKVCKQGKEKRTVFCYSSGCSIKEIP